MKLLGKAFTTVLLIVTVVILSQLYFGWIYAVTPNEWKTVEEGMTYELVLNTIGTPTADTSELKGQDTWRKVAILNERYLIVRYDKFKTVERVSERIYWRWSKND